MPAYVVALIHAITDPETYKRYVAQVEPTLRPFGGRFLARKPDPHALEGGPAPSRAVILEFPDESAARAWHASPDYRPVMETRQSASQGTLLILPGAEGAAPRPAVGDVCYVEMVTPDVDLARRACEAAYGCAFAPADERLGDAVVATLPNGARHAIRAPMHEMEKTVTRTYVRVADVKKAVAAAEAAGAFVAVSHMEIPGQGEIAIWFTGGIEHGAWRMA